MFLFIWVNYLNVSLMDFVFLEPSVFLYIFYFVELCFLAMFFAVYPELLLLGQIVFSESR